MKTREGSLTYYTITLFTPQLVILISSSIKKLVSPDFYEAYVGCVSAPSNPDIPGTLNWNMLISFTWWAQIFAALMVITPVIMMPIYYFKNRTLPMKEIPYLEGQIAEGFVVAQYSFSEDLAEKVGAVKRLFGAEQDEELLKEKEGGVVFVNEGVDQAVKLDIERGEEASAGSSEQEV